MMTTTYNKAWRLSRGTIHHNIHRCLCWRHIDGEDDGDYSVLDGIVATADRLHMVRDEEIGSMPLKITYFQLFFHHRE